MNTNRIRSLIDDLVQAAKIAGAQPYRPDVENLLKVIDDVKTARAALESELGITKEG